MFKPTASRSYGVVQYGGCKALSPMIDEKSHGLCGRHRRVVGL